MLDWAHQFDSTLPSTTATITAPTSQEEWATFLQNLTKLATAVLNEDPLNQNAIACLTQLMTQCKEWAKNKENEKEANDCSSSLLYTVCDSIRNESQLNLLLSIDTQPAQGESNPALDDLYKMMLAKVVASGGAKTQLKAKTLEHFNKIKGTQSLDQEDRTTIRNGYETIFIEKNRVGEIWVKTQLSWIYVGLSSFQKHNENESAESHSTASPADTNTSSGVVESTAPPMNVFNQLSAFVNLGLVNSGFGSIKPFL